MARTKHINVRATDTDHALLGLVARRLQRSRGDTVRLLIRSAALELSEQDRRTAAPVTGVTTIQGAGRDTEH